MNPSNSPQDRSDRPAASLTLPAIGERSGADGAPLVDPIPRDYSGQDPILRLELLVGHFADLLAPARELVARLRLRTNASLATRSDLALLNELSGAIWERLGMITEGLERLKAAKEKAQ